MATESIYTEVIKAGFVEKKSKILGVYRKRWMVIGNDNKLYSYKPGQQLKQQQYTEIFDLKDYAKISVSENDDKLEFMIQSQDNSRCFKCESQYEVNSWVQEIKNIHNMNQQDDEESNDKDEVYVHRIIAEHVTCPYMEEYNQDSDEKENIERMPQLQCPIFYDMKVNYQFTKENLAHLEQFNHFYDEYREKTPCKYGQECKKCIRLENGGQRVDDQCHLKLYRHPPRRRQLQLSENINPMIINTISTNNAKLYKPTQDDMKEYNKKDGFLLVFHIRC